MHGVKEPEEKTAHSDHTEDLSDKETVLWHQFSRIYHSLFLIKWTWWVYLNYSQSPLQNPRLKRLAEEEEGSPALNPRGSDSQPLKRLKVNILKVHKCAVCGFTTEDITAFHKHIPQHRSDGSSYQCQECGLCYTSHRSLARHLFIVHRLKEPQGLARYNGRGKDDDESQRENQMDIMDKNNDGTPNTKCKVCGKTFETETHLNTHMRTHGMAFIKSKRLNAVEKWWILFKNILNCLLNADTYCSFSHVKLSCKNNVHTVLTYVNNIHTQICKTCHFTVGL